MVSHFEGSVLPIYPCNNADVTLQVLETFVLVDAGGGTTDVGTYRIAKECPLRLNTEINDPSGMSSIILHYYLN